MSFFTPLIGQVQAVELLMQAVVKNRIAPAYLFAGANGIGRGLAARCFIEVLFSQDPTAQNRLRQGNHPDLLWVQPTYQHQGERYTPQEAAAKGIKRKSPPVIRLEQIREITEFLGRPAMLAPRSVVVIEQAETMAEGAANALLKTLEEPGRATLILIAPSVDAILPTLVSRCQKIPFYRLDVVGMAEVLNVTGHGEILQNPTIINLAAGSPGEAIASYEQMQAIPTELLQALQKTPANQRQALELARRIDKELDTEGQLWLVDYLQQLYWQQQYKANMIEELEKSRKYLLCYAQPRLVWECTLLKVVANS
ncbi:DNA polymerase III subunit delta' [Calothrix sp. UHCC 0171]|uniref:DNA polymerase III subunit delta' n=1 Tax=Calothrix sp. UHCC 0171 TaxID=3110245 RepID=UPI002B1F1AF3|nr:DNA polymerase III subunit delta' [Calothrix sp. UHCC 0171]MEA5574157.1 DNA polymerase III subunit delta' [Calothrix sp. UHCC 0171]